MKATYYFDKDSKKKYGYTTNKNSNSYYVHPLDSLVDEIYFPAGGLVLLKENEPLVEVY